MLQENEKPLCGRRSGCKFIGERSIPEEQAIVITIEPRLITNMNVMYLNLKFLFGLLNRPPNWLEIFNPLGVHSLTCSSSRGLLATNAWLAACNKKDKVIMLQDFLGAYTAFWRVHLDFLAWQAWELQICSLIDSDFSSRSLANLLLGILQSVVYLSKKIIM